MTERPEVCREDGDVRPYHSQDEICIRRAGMLLRMFFCQEVKK